MLPTRKIRAILAGFGLLAAGVATPATVAADEVTSNGAPLVLAQADTFEQDAIEAFAAAQLRIEEIRASYAAEFQAAETEEERQQINQQATEEMVAAVEATPNLTLDQFNEIIEAAQQDPSLAEQIDEAIADSQT